VAIVATIAVLSLGALALIGRFADYGRIADALRSADPRWLPVCAAGVCVVFAGYALAYHGFVRVSGGPRMGAGTSLRVALAAVGAGAAAASVGTLAVGFWAIRREGVPGAEATRRLLALSTYQWFVLGWAAVASGCLVLVLATGAAPPAMIAFWLVVVPLASGIGFLASNPARAARADSWAAERAAARDGGRRAAIMSVVRGAYAEAIGGLVLMRAVLDRPARHASAVAGFPVYWTGHLLVTWAALRSVGVSIGLTALVLAFATGYIASGVPLPGGAGSVDAGIAFSLAAVGVPLAEAVVATLIMRFFTLWLPLVPALAVLPTFRHDRDADAAAGSADLQGAPRSARVTSSSASWPKSS
jgi:uncharacterized membrane protein YbhN (UPF0104 family)